MKRILVIEPDEKYAALKAFTEHIIPNRGTDVRPPTDLELKATTVLSLPIEEASAKIRTGNPVDDEEDYNLEVWAGVIPLHLTMGKPVADEKMKDGILIPEYLSKYERCQS